MKETFDLINSDLSEAYTALKAYEATNNKDVAALLQPCAIYLSSYAVEALQARVALFTGDWATAKAKAEDVIEMVTIHSLIPLTIRKCGKMKIALSLSSVLS